MSVLPASVPAPRARRTIGDVEDLVTLYRDRHAPSGRAFRSHVAETMRRQGWTDEAVTATDPEPEHTAPDTNDDDADSAVADPSSED